MSAERKRSVDIEKLDEDTVNNIQESLIKKITKINDDAVKKANKLLNIYGLEVKMQFLMQKIEK